MKSGMTCLLIGKSFRKVIGIEATGSFKVNGILVQRKRMGGHAKSARLCNEGRKCLAVCLKHGHAHGF